MKLAERYNRANLLTSFIILVITGFSYYVVIHFILTDKLDRDLVIEEKEILAYAENYDKLPSPGDFLHQKVTYLKLKSGDTTERHFYYDNFYNVQEKENEPGRSLITSVNLNGINYQVTISKSRVESEDLVRLIFMITLAVTILLLVSLLLINRFVLQQIWKPFYATLTMMKAFNITQKERIVAQDTNIDEFEELNAAVTTMAESVKKDYKELKSFTDNASHEMMTPLAIINTKLDLLLQGEPLNEQQGKLIDEVYGAVSRLSKLNSSLLLLAKIENRMIPEQENLNLKILLEDKLSQLQELIENKQLHIETSLSNTEIKISKYLADILLNNLLSNAMRHNYTGGKIAIRLSQNVLTIANTSKADELDSKQTFERFYKTPSSEGMGLGLAIVKQIVSIYQFKIDYSFEDQQHAFKLSF